MKKYNAGIPAIVDSLIIRSTMQQQQSRPVSIEKFQAFLRSIEDTVETIFIERACLYALVLETGQYGPSEIDKAINHAIDKAINHAKENPAYQTAARTQFADIWKTLNEMGKAALLELQLQIPSTGKPN
jgi:hypothetical protein